jgi:hypothetical protein
VLQIGRRIAHGCFEYSKHIFALTYVFAKSIHACRRIC